MNLSRILAALALIVVASSAYATTTTSSTSSTVVTSDPGSSYPGGTYNGPANGSYTGMGTAGNMAGTSTTMRQTTTRTAAQANPQSNPMSAGASGVVADPSQIRSCLCLENQYKAMQGDVSAKQAAYNQATSQEASMNAQLANAKGGSDLNQVRAQSEQRIELQNQINAQYIPNLQQATDRYNNAVTAYQQSCGGKQFNADVMAQVQTHLACSQ